MQTKTLRAAVLLSIIGFSFSHALRAQTQLTGAVTDAGGQRLPAASVLLLKGADSTLVKGQLSSVAGDFVFDDIPPGQYRLEVSMLGFQDYFSAPFALDEQARKKDLGTVALQEAARQLDAVDIIAKKPLFEQKIDRLVVNVATSITSAGATALEVLQRSPGVSVNRGANSIGMSGRNGVVIMVNGKISRLPPDALIQLLDGMNADNIERIELIHTPPANFDAEGNAGIINIVLKKNADDGLNGGYSASAGYGKKEKAGANLNFNFRKNRVNLYGDYSWTYDNNPQVFTNFRSFERNDTIFETSSVSDRDPTRTHTQNGRLGLDVQLTPKTVVGGLVGWMDRYWTMDAVNAVTMKENGIPTGYITIPNDEINHWRHYLGNLNLEHQFTKDQRLNLDLDYAHYRFTNPTNYTNQYLDPEGALVDQTQLRVHKNTPMSILAAKADFTRNFGASTTLETGLKATVTRFDNDVLVEDRLPEGWVRNAEFSADYGMEEDIAAAYSALTVKVNDKTDLKAGLRYEFTRSNLGTTEQADIVDRHYGNLFPSLFLSRKFDKNNSVQLSYSRRINRPNFQQLAPYFIFYDPTTIETGNPKLQPSVTDALKADYLWKSVQLSLQYSYEANAIAGWQPDVDTLHNRQVNGSVNFDYARVASAGLSFPVRPFNWWEMQVNLNAQWLEFKNRADLQTPKQNQVSWFGFASQSFRLPRQFSIEMSGFYFSGGPFGRLYSHPIGDLTIGVQKELGGKRGTLRFNVSDVFLTGNWTGTVDDPAVNFHYKGGFRQTERVFRLTYSNKFGGAKVKAARQRSTGSEEERRRAN